MIIQRSQAKKLKELAKQFRVIALIGPRQSGKSTLAKITFPEYKYISLENLDDRARADQDPRLFLASLDNEHGIIIDEAQYVPALFSYIQTRVDQDYKPGYYILTGSQNFLLNEKISQSLAGRVAYLTLLPLSIDELKSAHILPNTVEPLLFKGSYPEVQTHNLSPLDWYPNYIRTYVERDVRLLKNIENETTFRRFISLCAGRVGQLLNVQSLANDCGISNTTAHAWLSILQTSYLIFLVQPHFGNYSKRLIKSPKLYFYDTGIICSLLGIESSQDLFNHYLRGGIFESFIFAELMKEFYNIGREPHLYFWRDSAGHEVDCIIEKGNNLTPIEIKAGMTVNQNYFTELKYWNTVANRLPEEKSYIVYAGADNQLHKTAEVISWQSINTIVEKLSKK